MTLTERVPHLKSTTAAGVKLAKIRKRALQHGFAIRTGNGGYMVVDPYGAMLAGAGFPLTLGDVEAFLRMWDIKSCNTD